MQFRPTARKHCIRRRLLFEGMPPFPVTAPTVVDAEGAVLSAKPPNAAIWRQHAAVMTTMALKGGIAMIDAIRLSLMLFWFLAGCRPVSYLRKVRLSF